MKIEKSKYQGYLWYSDQKEPKVINNQEFELEIVDNTNPFIVEGLLYDGENSISIKYVDGEYKVKIYNVKKLNSENSHKKEKEFLPNRMKDVEKLRFLEYWKPQEDSLCENMKVLQPAELVFIGFNNENKEE